MPFESLAGTKRIDEAMLEKLLGMTKQGSSKPSLGKAMAKFSMQETGVAKVQLVLLAVVPWWPVFRGALKLMSSSPAVMQYSMEQSQHAG